jgi:regulator of sigma E protease
MLGSIVVFLIVLSVLILVHELGHFLVARKNGIWVEEFGFGLPPRIWGKQIGETLYSINALPFGGFVRLHGEQEIDNRDREKERAFLNKSKKARVAVIIAGVIMNFLLALVCFAVVYSFSGIPKDTGKIKVVEIAGGSPAETAGVVVGDVIAKVQKDQVSSVDDFIRKTEELKGKTVAFEIVHQSGGQEVPITVQMKPRENPPEGEGPLGVTITTTEIYYPPIWQRPFYGVYYGFKEALFWGETIVLGLWGIIAGLFKGQAPVGVSGPVGIFAVTTEAVRSGILTLINFVGILSVNLAILNIIPFPALDGGRLLFIGIETLIGRKVLPKVEAAIHSAGMFILLALLLAITIGDIRRLVAAGGISGFIDSMVK